MTLTRLIASRSERNAERQLVHSRARRSKQGFKPLISMGLMLILMIGAALMVVPDQAAAADVPPSATTTISTGLNAAAGTSYSTTLTAPVFIGNMIRTLLAATGIVFLILTVYAGILYMTAAGEEVKVKKAKSMLTNAVIGMIIIVGAYAIASYVVNALAEAATATTAATP